MPVEFLTFSQLADLTTGRTVTDVPCPVCGPNRRLVGNRERRVLRVWRFGPSALSYNCARCGLKGALSRDSRAPGLRSQNSRLRPKAELLPNSVSKATLDRALAIWRSSIAARGTPVEVYLASRGLWLPSSDSIRFHPELRHPSGGVHPAMVALVTRGVGAEPIGIHRTFLATDGSGKAAVTPERMMLGPCRGGVVPLATPADSLMIGEGIETCLSVLQATGQPVWSALSTSGLQALVLPARVRSVMILADGDEPGEAAAREAGLRWSREGRSVRIARPPRGYDFNDVLLGRVVET